MQANNAVEFLRFMTEKSPQDGHTLTDATNLRPKDLEHGTHRGWL